MLTSWVALENPETIRKHHHVASPQGPIGEEFRNRIGDFAGRPWFDRRFGRRLIQTCNAPRYIAPLKIREPSIFVWPIYRDPGRRWKEQPEKAEEVLRVDGRGTYDDRNEAQDQNAP
jgi:hypothetical protein